MLKIYDLIKVWHVYYVSLNIWNKFSFLKCIMFIKYTIFKVPTSYNDYENGSVQKLHQSFEKFVFNCDSVNHFAII